MFDLKMPERQPGDTGIAVTRLDNGYIRVSYGGDSKEPYVCAGSIVVSPFNAWRVVGFLCVLLQIPMARAFAKACKSGPESEAKFK